MESCFAEIDSNGIVLRVIVANQNFINSGLVGDPKNWIQTNNDSFVGKNYVGIGMKYDKQKDFFIGEKPFESWILAEVQNNWVPPQKIPIDSTTKQYVWNEEILNWVILKK